MIDGMKSTSMITHMHGRFLLFDFFLTSYDQQFALPLKDLWDC